MLRLFILNKFVLRVISLALLLYLFAIKLLAQNTTTFAIIEGKVTDLHNEALAGATIRLQGTELITSTDIDGYFKINYKKKSDSQKVFLNISFIGMKNKVVVWENKFLRVILKEDKAILNEVVVKAKPNINDIDLRAKSGVVSEVDMRDLLQKPMIDMSMALQGSVPGLVVVSRGELGRKPEIRIRSNNSFRHGDIANEPLYVMDGKIISSEAFITLNPLDIKEIKVLKDAAASALYGVKAANGVIEISSRRGVAGPLRIAVSSNWGITLRGKRPMRMMQTAEKLEFERRVQAISSPGYILSPDFYNNVSMSDVQSLYNRLYAIPVTQDRDFYAKWAENELNRLKSINTDWFNDLLHNNSYHNYNISLRGGNNDIAYYISANYSKQGGQLPGNDSQRISLSNSMDWQTKSGFISLTSNLGYSLINTPNGTNSSLNTMIYELNPYENRETKKLYSYPGRSFSELMNQFRRKSSDLRVGSTLSFNLRPIKSLNIDAMFGGDFVLSDSEEITPATSPLELRSGKPPILRGSIGAGRNTTFNYSSNIRATYHNVFNNKHELTISANTDYYYTKTKLLSVYGHGIGRLESLAGVNKAKGTSYAPDFNGSNIKTAQIGLGTSIGYTYNSIYDIFGAYKMDASSVLPPSKRWNTVWALGAGIHLDKLLSNTFKKYKGNKILTALVIKSSIGSTASLGGIPASLALPVFSYDPNAYYGNFFRELKLAQMYNSDLKPERVRNFDLGLELRLVKRFILSLQYYQKDTYNALLSVSIPSSNGFSTLLKNVGQLRNRGLELSVSAQLLQTDKISLSTRASLAHNRSLVVDLYEGKAIYTDADAIFPEYEEGQPYDALFALKSIGVNPLTGEPMFVNKNGEEKPFYSSLTRDDFLNVGYSSPPYQGSVSINFTWSNFDLNAQLYYVFGGLKPYSMTYVRDKTNANKNAVEGQLERTWFKSGDDYKLYPSPNSSQASFANLSQYANTRMIASSDYLRLSMLSLSYRVPSKYLDKIGSFIKHLSASMQMSNLFTLSPYKGSSPESGTYDIGVQPVYSLNININF